MIFLIFIELVSIGIDETMLRKRYLRILLSYRETSISIDLMGCFEAMMSSIFMKMSSI